jgi:hypothetical protein
MKMPPNMAIGPDVDPVLASATELTSAVGVGLGVARTVTAVVSVGVGVGTTTAGHGVTVTSTVLLSSVLTIVDGAYKITSMANRLLMYFISNSFCVRGRSVLPRHRRCRASTQTATTTKRMRGPKMVTAWSPWAPG